MERLNSESLAKIDLNWTNVKNQKCHLGFVPFIDFSAEI
jgi:hypothetical protein